MSQRAYSLLLTWTVIWDAGDLRCHPLMSCLLFNTNTQWHQFLPLASFGLRVLLLPASVCVSMCLCVYQSLACPHDNSGTIQTRITKFGPKMQKTLFFFIVLGAVNLDLQGQIQLKSLTLPNFDLVHTIIRHMFKLRSPNLHQRCKIAWLRPLLFWVAIDLDLHSKFSVFTTNGNT